MNELIKLTERIYYLPADSETDRPYLYYIKGTDYSVAIDAGNSRMHVQLFYDKIKQNNMPLPKYTIITHWHWDHSFGIPYIHGQSIATNLTNQKLNTVSTWLWNPTAMKERELTGEDISLCNNYIQMVYKNLDDIKVTPADISISEVTQLNLGDLTLQLIPHDSTHSRDSLFIFCPEEKLLFVGDADCEDHYEGNGTFDKEKLSSLLAFIEGINFDTYLLGHDIPATREEALNYLNECFRNIPPI